MRKALDGTGNQIEAEYVQQGNEPPGVIHVEKAKLCIYLQLGGTDLGNILRWQLPLRQNSADYRCERQRNQQKEGKLK